MLFVALGLRTDDRTARLLVQLHAGLGQDGLLREYRYPGAYRQGEGVGRRLMRELLSRAARLDGLEQVHLCVVAGNESARGLYASLGFETYGVEPNALIVDGKRFDEAHMVYFLERG